MSFPTYVVQRRWEVFHFHPAASPPPLSSTEPIVNYNADGSSPVARDMDGGTGQEDQHWRSFDSSVNAVSFGFVATAILISMFLVMAIFERFLRPNSTDDTHQQHHHHSGGGGGNNGRGGEAERNGGRRLSFRNKLGFPESPKMSVYSKGVSVLMPGEQFPTFIAHPVSVPAPIPIPSPPRRLNLHQYYHHHHHHHNSRSLIPPRHSTTSSHGSFG